MEKRRRARINNCLNELKSLILDAMKKDVSWTFIITKEIVREFEDNFNNNFSRYEESFK